MGKGRFEFKRGTVHKNGSQPKMKKKRGGRKTGLTGNRTVREPRKKWFRNRATNWKRPEMT